jgi:hypothetical protein
VKPTRRSSAAARRSEAETGRSGRYREVVDQVEADDLGSVRQAPVRQAPELQLRPRLGRRPAGAAADVEPAHRAVGGAPDQLRQDVEAQLTGVSSGARQPPLAVHGAVGHHRRRLQGRVVQQALGHPPVQ